MSKMIRKMLRVYVIVFRKYDWEDWAVYGVRGGKAISYTDSTLAAIDAGEIEKRQGGQVKAVPARWHCRTRVRFIQEIVDVDSTNS